MGSCKGSVWSGGNFGKAGEGFQTRPRGQKNPYGQDFGKQEELSEVSGWSQDWWDLNGIHDHAQVGQLRGSLCRSQTDTIFGRRRDSHVQKMVLKKKPVRRKEPTLKGKITNRCTQSLLDFMREETTVLENELEEARDIEDKLAGLSHDRQFARGPMSFLGHLKLSDSGLRQVQDVEGYHWKPASSMVGSVSYLQMLPLRRAR